MNIKLKVLPLNTAQANLSLHSKIYATKIQALDFVIVCHCLEQSKSS